MSTIRAPVSSNDKLLPPKTLANNEFPFRALLTMPTKSIVQVTSPLMPLQQHQKIPCSSVPHKLGNNGHPLRKSNPMHEVPPCTDLIQGDPGKYQELLNKNLQISPDLDPDLKAELLNIIHSNWDAFDPEGAARPMLCFEFCIDTGACKVLMTIRMPHHPAQNRRVALTRKFRHPIAVASRTSS